MTVFGGWRGAVVRQLEAMCNIVCMYVYLYDTGIIYGNVARRWCQVVSGARGNIKGYSKYEY